jgi:transposase
MAKAYSDDLRRRLLSAYEAGEGTLEELAERFMVSLAYGKKVHGQFQRSGQMERVEQRRGTPRKLLDGPREQLRVWLIAAPDLTLEQLGEKLRQDCGISISCAQVARALKRMGLKLKKKSLHACERDTEENRRRREEFVQRLGTIALEKLIFLDESGVTTRMTRPGFSG